MQPVQAPRRRPRRSARCTHVLKVRIMPPHIKLPKTATHVILLELPGAATLDAAAGAGDVVVDAADWPTAVADTDATDNVDVLELVDTTD